MKNKPLLTSQNPWTGIMGGIVGLAIAIVLSIQLDSRDWWGDNVNRYWLLYGVAGIVLLLMIFLDRLTMSLPMVIPSSPPPTRLFKRVTCRYLSLGMMMIIASCIYFVHPFYQTDFYKPFRSLFKLFILIYAVGGWPYIYWTLLRNPPSSVSDNALYPFAWCRHWKTIFRRRSRIVLLGFVVEGFYLPLMSVFLLGEFNQFSNAFHRLRFNEVSGFIKHETIYAMGYHGMYYIDALLAMIGYFSASRWLGNKIRSVDLTVLGWASALSCYPPFNGLTDTYFPWPSHDDAYLIIQSHWIRDLLMGAILSLTAIYVLATMMFGLRFSNLTNRGILDRGPYAWVRHPAYAAKNISWWLESLPWFGNLGNILGIVGWSAIYVVRTWTEERHLGSDSSYLAYKAKVRYRFIPGVY